MRRERAPCILPAPSVKEHKIEAKVRIMEEQEHQTFSPAITLDCHCQQANERSKVN